MFRKSGSQHNVSDTELDRLPDKANDWDAIWDAEERRHLQVIALAELKTKVSDNYSISYYKIESWPLSKEMFVPTI